MGLRAESGVTVYRSMKRAGTHNDVQWSPKNSERVRRFNETELKQRFYILKRSHMRYVSPYKLGYIYAN